MAKSCIYIACLLSVALVASACRTRTFNSDARAENRASRGRPEELAWRALPAVSVGACVGEAVVAGKPLLLAVRNFDGNYSSVVRLEVIEGTLESVTESSARETLTLSGAGRFLVVPGFGGRGGSTYLYASDMLGYERLGDGTTRRHLAAHLAWFEKNPSEKNGPVYERRLRQVEALSAAHGEQLLQRVTLGSQIPELGTPTRASAYDIAVAYAPDPNRADSGANGTLALKWTIEGSGRSFEAKLQCASAYGSGFAADALDAAPGALGEFFRLVQKQRGKAQKAATL